MRAAKEKPLSPTSLATGGDKGRDAKANGPCGVKDTFCGSGGVFLAPTLKGCRCQCAECGELFASPRAFDRHRVGDYAEPGQWQGARRCVPVADLLADGWSRNPRGFLLTPDARRAGAGVSGPRVTPPGIGVAA